MCDAVFTTLEAVDTVQALRLDRVKRYEPFSRDTLLLSIYDSLKHRKTASADATALTATVMTKLLPMIRNATISRLQLIEITTSVLQNFDKAAATHYQAFHP